MRLAKILKGSISHLLMSAIPSQTRLTGDNVVSMIHRVDDNQFIIWVDIGEIGKRRFLVMVSELRCGRIPHG